MFFCEYDMRCVFFPITQGDVGYRGPSGLPGPPGEGLQGLPVSSDFAKQPFTVYEKPCKH